MILAGRCAGETTDTFGQLRSLRVSKCLPLSGRSRLAVGSKVTTEELVPWPTAPNQN
jgi:hypothetical protein